MDASSRAKQRTDQLAAIGAASGAVAALVVLITGLLGEPNAAVSGSVHTPVAPEISLLVFLLGGALFLRLRWPAHPAGRLVGFAVVGITMLLTAVALFSLFQSAEPPSEAGAAEAGILSLARQVESMALVTAMMLAGMAAALGLGLLRPERHAALRRFEHPVARLVLAGCSLAILSHLAGAARLLGGDQVLPALTTAVLCLPLALALFVCAEPEGGRLWPTFRTPGVPLSEAEMDRGELSQCLSQMLDNLDDVIMLSDPERRIVEVNRQAEVLYGYSRQELRGMVLTALRAPEVRDAFEDTRNDFESGERIVFQTVHRCKDGTTFPVEISSRWVDFGGARYSLGVIRDIRERRAAEEKLRRNEERLRYALEGATDGLWDWNLMTGELYLSPRYLEMLGYPPESLPRDRDHWRKLIHPEDLPRAEHALEDYLAGHLPVYRCEYRMRTQGGEWLWLLARGKVISRDSRGKPARIVGTHSDISQRQRAEAALVASERAYREIFNATTEAIFIYDAESGELLDVNESMLRLYGYATREEVLGSTAAAFSAEENLDSSLAMPRPGTGAFTSTAQVFEWRARRKNGESLWVEVSLRHTRIAGQHCKLAVARDISARKLVEEERERLIAILERTPDFVSTADLQGRTTYVNATGRRLVGLDADANVADRQIPEYHPAWAADLALKEGLPAARRDGIWVGETALRGRNGTEIPVSQVIMAHKDAQGRVTHYSTIMRDLTERKRMEQILRTNEERLRTIIGHSTQLHYSHTPDHVLTFVSPQCREFFDCEPEEAMVRWTELVTDNPVNQRGMELTEAAIRTGQRQPLYELELISRKGRKSWVEVRESPVVIKGKTVSIVGSLTDITQRKRSEEIVHRLTQLGRDLGTATESAQASQMVADVAQDLLGWDACFLKVRTPDLRHAHFMLSMDTVNGERVTVPSPVAAMDQISPIEQRVLDEGALLILRELQTKEMFIPFGDKGRPSLSLLYVPLRHQGRYLGLLSIQSYRHHAYDRDALELLHTLANHAAGALERIRAEQALRESEDRYRTLFEQATEGIALADAETGILTDCNQALLDMVGRERSEVIGRPQSVLHPPRENGAQYSRTFERHRSGDHDRLLEDDILTKNGERRVAEIKARVFEVNGRKIVQGFYRDITERRQAEQALAQRERRYRSLFDLSPVGIILEDASGNILDTNAAMGAILGYQREELLGRNVRQLVPPQYLGDVDGHVARVFAGETLAHETDSLARDGTLRRVELRETAVPLPDGSQGILVLVQDISERSRAEAALRESEARYRFIAENTADAIWMFDLARDRFTFASPSVERLRGYTVEEVLKQNLKQAFTPEAYRVIHQRLTLRLGRFAAGDRSALTVTNEVPITRKDGPPVETETVTSLVTDAQGQVTHILGVTRDITERKAAARALEDAAREWQSTFDALSDSILVLDREFRILRCNKASEDLFERDRDAILGRPCWEVGHGTEAPPPQSPVLRMRQSGRRESLELTSGERWLATSVEPMFGDTGELVGAVQITSDITERKQAEAALRESERRNRSIVQSSPLGMHMYSLLPDDRLVFTGANKSADWMLGVSHDQYLGKDIEEAFPNLKGSEIPQRYREAAIRGVPWHNSMIEYEDKQIKGAFEIFAFQTAPGQVAVMFQDITERRQAEERQHRLAAENERLLKNLQLHFDSMPIGCIVTRPDMTVMDWNPAATRIFGFTRKEMLGKLPFGRIIPTASRCAVEQFMADLVGSSETRSTLNQNLTKDDRTIVCEWHETPLRDEAGGVVGVLAMVQDMTDRLRAEAALRETERRLTTVLANLPAGFAYHCRNDRDWTMEFITAGVETLTGASPEEFTEHDVVYNDLIHPGDRDRVYDEVQAAVNNRQPFLLEYRVLSRDGEEKWVWEQGRGVFDESGASQGLEGLVVDITARKCAETELRGLSGRLLAAQDEERRRIARDLHDTTAQTIAALCMNLTLLQSRVQARNRDAQRLLTDAMGLGERASQEVRTVSYLLHPPILEHAGLAGAIREFAAGFDRRSGIQVTVDIGTGLPRFCPEVELALLRVVQESLGNVHRHSGSTTAAIRLEVSGERITLEVCDTGTGFDPKEMSKKGQLGVGIAGMRERLRLLGGNLDIASGAGGTQVCATLPLSGSLRTEAE